MDRDFWWHIKAGEILLHTQKMVLLDPFAYARAGLPYLATHEWLAQIVLFLVYSLGGSIGIILFRGVIACACMWILLSIAQQKRFVYIVLAVWAVVITKGSYLERPQLFTFLFFAVFLHFAFRFLESESLRSRLWICAGFIALELLWVNMHGGAALLGCAVLCFLLLQTGVSALSAYKRGEALLRCWLLLGTLFLMATTLILPPNGFGTFTYLSQLMNDKTIAFIAEWQPREWGLYLYELWPFYILSFCSLAIGRRYVVFNGLLLLAMAYLSRQAFRHEILFVFAATATCFYQLDRAEKMDVFWMWQVKRPLASGVLSFLLVLFLAHTAVVRSYGFERQDNLFGFGQFDLARGAADFIEREHITGNMFNTYGIGGYLIYRGYPDRKVFIDGRNVDYGFDYMARAYAAGLNTDRWDDLVYQYNITYAIVDYDAIKQNDRLPYSSILDVHPNWTLVYLDDWTAVYVKNIPENQSIIERLKYNYVNPTTIQFDNAFSKIEAKNMPALLQELHRMQSDNPQGIKATTSLASIALKEKRFDDVVALVEKAQKIRPMDPEPLALLAGVYTNQGKWKEAAETYAHILRIAGDNYPNMNYGYIAKVFEKAGWKWKAWYYRQGTEKNVGDQVMNTPAGTKNSQFPHSSGTTSSPSFGVNPAADAIEFHTLGLALIEEGKTLEAEEAFLNSLKMNPSAAEVWNNLCAVRLTLKKNQEAIEACKRAIDLEIKLGDAHYNLALAYFNEGKMLEAEKEAKSAVTWGRKKEANELLFLIKKRAR